VLKQDVMNNSQKQLLDLVKLAIHPEIEIPESLKVDTIDWKEVLEEARKQSLMGVAFVGFKIWSASDYVKKSGATIDKRLLTQWAGTCEKIREDNLLLNKRTAQVCKNFAKEGFRTSVMKGQGNALLYGENLSLMRSPGDIDVWVEGGFEKVYGYVQKVAPTDVVNEKEIQFNVFSDTSVEIHYRPFIIKQPFKNRILQTFLESKAEACYNNHVKLKAKDGNDEDIWVDAVITTIPFNLVQQMAHIKLHLFTGGIGLRQVMDYYYQLVHVESSLLSQEKKEIVEVVKSLGLERLAKALMWILVEFFQLPQVCLLWKPCKKDGEYLLDKFLRTGSFEQDDKSKNRKIQRETFSSFYNIQKQNLKLLRFDRWDWFWGSLWRIYHFAWRKARGFRH